MVHLRPDTLSNQLFIPLHNGPVKHTAHMLVIHSQSRCHPDPALQQLLDLEDLGDPSVGRAADGDRSDWVERHGRTTVATGGMRGTASTRSGSAVEGGNGGGAQEAVQQTSVDKQVLTNLSRRTDELTKFSISAFSLLVVKSVEVRP